MVDETQDNDGLSSFISWWKNLKYIYIFAQVLEFIALCHLSMWSILTYIVIYKQFISIY